MSVRHAARAVGIFFGLVDEREDEEARMTEEQRRRRRAADVAWRGLVSLPLFVLVVLGLIKDDDWAFLAAVALIFVAATAFVLVDRRRKR